MNGKTHMIVSGLACAAVSVDRFPSVEIGGINVYPVAGIIPAIMVASWADIDLSNSNAALTHKIAAKIFTHRGMTHTLVFPLAIAYLLVMLMVAPNTVPVQLLASIVYGALIGYLGHIWADNLNQKGTPTFWPVCRERIHVMSIATGTVQETLFLITFCSLSFLQIVLTLGGRGL